MCPSQEKKWRQKNDLQERLENEQKDERNMEPIAWNPSEQYCEKLNKHLSCIRLETQGEKQNERR
jgi:hypothetical protein